jgi:hypothetical protein
VKKELIKYLSIIIFIIIGCVIIAHSLGGNETVADVAERNKTTDVSVVPEIEEIPQISDIPEITMTPSPTPTPTPTPEPTPETSENDELTETVNEAQNGDFYIEEISDELKEKMRGKSYADDIDESIVNFDMLRHVVIKYNDFEGNVKDGELVCNELIAEDLLEIFKELYESGYMLEEVSLIDKYDADDDMSMEANNTSCFNYRLVDRSTKLSYHAYGLAIDVNPFYNPYVEYGKGENGSDYICPTQSVFYAYRDNEFPYKIDENDLCYKLFKQHGFKWGGDWNSCKDYQHFEKRLISR